MYFIKYVYLSIKTIRSYLSSFNYIPSQETSGTWGGMDAGAGMLYPASVVDGLVHQLGGLKLSLQCKIIKALKGGCPTGTSVVTTHGDEMLTQIYEQIVHTSPPFYNHTNACDDEGADNLLRSCYQSAFNLAFDDNLRRENTRQVASPLLGAGARGFPIEVAIEIAASESMRWRDTKDNVRGEKVLMFGLLELKTSEELILALEVETLSQPACLHSNPSLQLQ